MKYFALIAFTCVLVLSAKAQHLNRLNKKGQRTGHWITYEDSAKKIKSFEGYFRNGRVKRTAWYYKQGGVLERKETNRWGILHTVNYHPNGKVRNAGKAKIRNTTEKIQYYYFGRWKYFDQDEELYKYCYYKKGEIVKTEYVGKKYRINDSLRAALNAIDTNFRRYGSFLIGMVDQSTEPYKAEIYRDKLYRYDSLSFKGIEKILGIYGYPSQYVVGEMAIVPFYIMSYAPRLVRNKYEQIFLKAADKGDIEWTSMAYFIDKLRVSWGKPQVYGTQYTYDKRGVQRYYTIEDPEHLAERRKKVGLPEEQ